MDKPVFSSNPSDYIEYCDWAEAEIARLREALGHVAYFGLDDSLYTAMKMRERAKAALQQGEDDG